TASLMVDTEQSVFIPFLAVLIWSLATMVLGLRRSEAPAWFGAIRVGVQSLMGILPAWIACLCAGVRSGSFRWSEIAASQGSGPMSWAAFSDPFQLLAMVVFLVSGMAVLGVAPLEGGYEHSDLSGGVFSRFSGTQVILFRIGRVYAFFVWALITAVLFLGAWNLPEGIIARLGEMGAGRTRLIAETVVLVAKTVFISGILFWAARANPKTKIDQIADLIWKVLTPGAVIALVGTTFWVGLQRWGGL
ncbi:MAG: NADH-quinone oxidoreductase subunit H, partial [Bdellovibrionota bacterium]